MKKLTLDFLRRYWWLHLILLCLLTFTIGMGPEVFFILLPAYLPLVLGKEVRSLSYQGYPRSLYSIPVKRRELLNYYRFVGLYLPVALGLVAIASYVLWSKVNDPTAILGLEQISILVAVMIVSVGMFYCLVFKSPSWGRNNIAIALFLIAVIYLLSWLLSSVEADRKLPATWSSLPLLNWVVLLCGAVATLAIYIGDETLYYSPKAKTKKPASISFLERLSDYLGISGVRAHLISDFILKSLLAIVIIGIFYLFDMLGGGDAYRKKELFIMLLLILPAYLYSITLFRALSSMRAMGAMPQAKKEIANVYGWGMTLSHLIIVSFLCVLGYFILGFTVSYSFVALTWIISCFTLLLNLRFTRFTITQHWVCVIGMILLSISPWVISVTTSLAESNTAKSIYEEYRKTHHQPNAAQSELIAYKDRLKEKRHAMKEANARSVLAITNPTKNWPMAWRIALWIGILALALLQHLLLLRLLRSHHPWRPGSAMRTAARYCDPCQIPFIKS